MKSLTKFLAACGAVFFASVAWAADPLVDVAWVRANLDNKDVVFVDLRPKPAYLAGHIPGAVHTQYGGKDDQWRTKIGEVRGLVRDPALIAEHLGAIGVSNNDHVVLIPNGLTSSEMGAATRVYWTLNYLGLDEVSILNGGMAAYMNELDANKMPVNPMEAGVAEIVATDFVVELRPEMLVSAEEVEAMATEGVLLVDNRTNDFYVGLSKSGAAKQAGTLTGAANLPHTWVTTNATGTFREPDALAKIYAAAGIPTSGPQISFCNTGQLASMGWFVSHELLGNEDAMIFDGSMAEWTHSGYETERKIDF